jgi:hypothetical protein
MARDGAPRMAKCEQKVCLLCRARHKRHHADNRIMPTSFGTRQIAVEIAHFETTRSA